jgi:asparagine synthase (glutamine-hydrolysing)
VLIDKRQGKAFVFNDRYGAERIYWHETEGAVSSPTTPKALLRILLELGAFDEEGVAQLFNLLDAPWTNAVSRCPITPGGSVCYFENGKCHQRKCFSPEMWESQPTLTAKSFFPNASCRVLIRTLGLSCPATVGKTFKIGEKFV